MDRQTLALWARQAGFSETGFCNTESFDEARRVVESQPALSERRQLRFDPMQEYPQARSLCVLLWAYAQAPLPDPASVFIDSYYEASNAAYRAACQLEIKLLEAGCFAKANVAYPAREAAVRAGLGIIGHNGMLITKQHGTRVVILLMATDLPVSTEPIPSCDNHCAQCGRCIRACPVGAISEEGMNHPERCLRNYMMEGIVVPQTLRPLMSMRLLGCDECQRVCPMQVQEPLKKEWNGEMSWHLSDFLTSDDAMFSQNTAKLAQHIGRNVARPQRVRAQAALLAGNLGNQRMLPTLDIWSDSAFDAVRIHARWAAEQIRTKEKKQTTDA